MQAKGADIWALAENEAKRKCEKARKDLADTLSALDSAKEALTEQQRATSESRSYANTADHQFGDLITKVNGVTNDYKKGRQVFEHLSNQNLTMSEKIAIFQYELGRLTEECQHLYEVIEKEEKRKKELANKNQEVTKDIQKILADCALIQQNTQERLEDCALREKEIEMTSTLQRDRREDLEKYEVALHSYRLRLVTDAEDFGSNRIKSIDVKIPTFQEFLSK